MDHLPRRRVFLGLVRRASWALMKCPKAPSLKIVLVFTCLMFLLLFLFKHPRASKTRPPASRPTWIQLRGGKERENKICACPFPPSKQGTATSYPMIHPSDLHLANLHRRTYAYAYAHSLPRSGPLRRYYRFSPSPSAWPTVTFRRQLLSIGRPPVFARAPAPVL